jgi:hypothetical protein
LFRSFVEILNQLAVVVRFQTSDNQLQHAAFQIAARWLEQISVAGTVRRRASC